MAAVPIDTGWTVVALVIPMLLAAGNVYRTLDWPPATGPILLAAGSHLAAALGLVIALAAFGNPADVATLSRVLGLTTAQVMASVAMFVFFFRLQAVGGPVYLSQISYVAAAVALISGLLFLGESYSVTTWAGALIVCIGIAITTRAQRSATV
jgi:drug/metabolite transporter (DMT)-like permease